MKKTGNGYRVTFSIGIMIRLIMGGCIVFGASDDVKVEKLVICLSSVVLVV